MAQSNPNLERDLRAMRRDHIRRKRIERELKDHGEKRKLLDGARKNIDVKWKQMREEGH